MEIEDTKTNGHGSEDEYTALLEELAAKGIETDAKDVSEAGGMNLLNMGPQRHSNASILASVPNAERYYDKASKKLALLLDLLSRTTFRSRKEIIHFNEWVDWCQEFTEDYDAPIRYLVAVNSENGKSREQYTDAITTFRMRNYGNNSHDKARPKPQEGKLS